MKPRRLARSRPLLASLAALMLCTTADADAPAVMGAWIPETPPGARVAAGYLQLQNLTDETLVLTGGMSERFGRVEMHRTEMDDGVARMREIERLELAPGETVSFEPGAMHLMIELGEDQSIGAGEQVPLVIESNLGPIAFTAPVLRADEVPTDGASVDHLNHERHGEMDHGEMDHGATDDGDGDGHR